MSTTSAAQLARLRTRFPQWDIIRTQCGTFIAHHQVTGGQVTAHTLAELENRLTGWAMHARWPAANGTHEIQAGQVAVRRAAAGDAARIAELLTQLGYPATGAEVARRLGYWLADAMSRVLVAELGGLVIGCLSVHAVPYLERTGRWARIESLVVDEPARGSGAGWALVTAAEVLAREWGCLAIEVTSARSRAGAHAFYERMGYTDICDRSGRFLKALP